MDPAKQKFLEFVQECTKHDKQAEAAALVDEVSEKLNEGSISKSYLTGVLPRALPLLKPEYAQKVKSLIIQYAMGGLHNAYEEKRRRKPRQ